MAEKVRNEGTLRLEPLGDSRVRRIAEITVEAKVFGIGGMIESTLAEAELFGLTGRGAPSSVGRLAARLTGAVLVLLAGVVLALVVRYLRPGTLARVTMAWSRLLLRALGVRVAVSRGFAFVGGAAVAAKAVSDEAGVLLVANHISWLDPLVMAAVLPSTAAT